MPQNISRKDSARTNTSERNTVPSLFARQSSQSGLSSSPPDNSRSIRIVPTRLSGAKSKTTVPEKRRKRNDPPPSKDVIVISSSTDRSHISISSDSPSHISISSDSVVSIPRFQPSTSTNGIVSPQISRVTRVSELSVSTPPQQPLPPTPQSSSPRRRRKRSAPKTRLSQKRQLDSDTEPEDAQATTSLQRKSSSKGYFPPVKSASVLAKPFTPKDNFLSSPSRSSLERCSTPFKRPRLGSVEPALNLPSSGNDADEDEFVPSSQSDEQDLCSPKIVKRNPEQVNESVDRWRKEAHASQPNSQGAPLLLDVDMPQGDVAPVFDRDAPDAIHEDVPMDVDIDVSSDVPRPDGQVNASQPNSSETEVSALLRSVSSTPSRISISLALPTAPSDSATTVAAIPDPIKEEPSPISSVGARLSTPPPPEESKPLPATPRRLDPASKAAQIIAQIKAAAMEAACSSPEEPLPELSELEDSSDESDDGGIFARFKVDKGKDKAEDVPASNVVTLSSPSESEGATQHRRTSSRYNFRHHSPGANNRMTRGISLGDSNTSKRRKQDPLEVLLKEKKLADRRGKGMDALRAAEAAVASSSKSEDIKMETDDEGSSDRDYGDEDAAMRIVQRARSLKLRSSSPLTELDAPQEDDDSSEDEEVADDCIKHLDKEEGAKVTQILAKDRKDKTAKGGSKKKQIDVLGVPFWETVSAEEMMEVDRLPELSLESTQVDNNPALKLLLSAIKGHDTIMVTILLNSPIIRCVEDKPLSSLIPWLFKLATSPLDVPYTEPAYHLLLHIYSLRDFDDDMTLTSPLMDNMCQMGVLPTALEVLQWSPSHDGQRRVSQAHREEVVYKITSLISAFAKRTSVSLHHLPQIVLTLILVGLDPSSSPDLRRDIVSTIENLVRYNPGSDDQAVETLMALCSRLVPFARSLAPINQSHMLSLIPGSCSRSICMARVIARCLLLELDAPPADWFTSLPPLAPIIQLLSPHAGSEELFDIPGNNDKNDYYDDLSYHINILSRALTDIDQYVVCLEKGGNAKAVIDDTSDQKPKKEPQLEQIKMLLQGLHGKIYDTKAAHLDRSRTKAALQQLSFRVFYQRKATLRHRAGSDKPRTLFGYWAKNKATPATPA